MRGGDKWVGPVSVGTTRAVSGTGRSGRELGSNLTSTRVAEEVKPRTSYGFL